jgi:hypothetical protein
VPAIENIKGEQQSFMRTENNVVGSAAKQRKKGKRGSAAPNDLRNLLKIAASLLKDFPFAEERVIEITRAVNKAIESQRTRDSAHADEHESTRADLGAMFDGAIERAIRNLPVKEGGTLHEDYINRKKRFGRRWRRNEQYYFTPEQSAELKEGGTI